MGNQVKHSLLILSIFLFSLTIISCGEKDESTDETTTTDNSNTDTTAPVIAEVTAVTTPSTDTTPDYTFSSDEAGTITYGGSCSSGTTSATSGNNTITFTSLSAGTYSDCTIIVTDSDGNTVTKDEATFQPAKYTFKFTIDDSGAIEHIRLPHSYGISESIGMLEQYTIRPNYETHQNPFVYLHWGTPFQYSYYGQVTALKYTYTFFDINGNPLRAEVTLTVTELVTWAPAKSVATTSKV